MPQLTFNLVQARDNTENVNTVWTLAELTAAFRPDTMTYVLTFTNQQQQRGTKDLAGLFAGNPKEVVIISEYGLWANLGTASVSCADVKFHTGGANGPVVGRAVTGIQLGFTQQV